MSTIVTTGTVLKNRGEIAVFLGKAKRSLYPDGVHIQRGWDWAQTIPASHIGTEWVPVEGWAEFVEMPTGRWVSPYETQLLRFTCAKFRDEFYRRNHAVRLPDQWPCFSTVDRTDYVLQNKRKANKPITKYNVIATLQSHKLYSALATNKSRLEQADK